jgi:hypothetical protein
MIPVRVPAGVKPVLAGDRRFPVPPGHPFHGTPCPACDLPLGYGATVLVLIGTDPGPEGAARGKAIAVHASCAGVPEQEPETPRRTVTLDITSPDARHALTQALEDYTARERYLARREGGNEARERWADLADRMREQAEAAG